MKGKRPTGLPAPPINTVAWNSASRKLLYYLNVPRGQLAKLFLLSNFNSREAREIFILSNFASRAAREIFYTI